MSWRCSLSKCNYQYRYVAGSLPPWGPGGESQRFKSHQMFPPTTYATRRQRLADLLPTGLLFLPGNAEAPMNYRHNTYPFRQDSTFRYFAGHNLPDLALTIDADTGRSRLWGDDFTLDDVVWMGEQPAVKELAERVGADYGGTRAQLSDLLKKHADEVHFLPPYRADRVNYLRDHLGADAGASVALIKAVVELRSAKSREEIAEMENAVATSMAMHHAALRHAAPGQLESEVAGLIEGMAIGAGGRLAYPAIVTRNGQVLHNHYHGNTLAEGDLLLIDAGAETGTGYAGDITRTFAVGTQPDERQQAILNLVHKAKVESIAAIRPGVTYRSIHDGAGEILFAGLKELGLTQGDPAEAVAAGAHALFMPHGLGHMIGLDVHDMEDLGEDYVGYDDESQRSDQFGTRALRLGRRLREGFALTVEPGCYFIPALIDRWEGEGLHRAFINYEALAGWREFGGVRLEDNVVVTEEGVRNLWPG